MAIGSGFGFEPEVAGAMFAGLEQYLKAAPADETTVGLLARFRRRISAAESRVLADMKASGNSNRNNESAARATGASKAEARRAAARAAAVEKNRKLSDALAEGDIGESQLDAIAMASDQTDGAGATSEDLLDKVKTAGPDKAAAVARSWVDEQKSQDEHDERYDRQRRRRKVSRFTTNRGTDAVMAEGDTEAIDRIMDRIYARADELYKADGGRKLSADQHPRTHDQRMFDAFVELMSESASPAANDSNRGSAADTTFHVLSYAEDWTEHGPSKAFSLDGRRLPTKLLNTLLCNAVFVGTVFDGDGEVLFHGREKRLATPAQVRALIARDRGCVQCGADPARCQAHHLTPFNSPKAGTTDIDAMALVCNSCHHELHANNHTLYWTNAPPNKGPTDETSRASPTRFWKTRPATPDEIAPKRKAA